MITHPIAIPATHNIGFTVNPKDASGNPAALDAPVTVESLHPAIATVGWHSFILQWIITSQSVGVASVVIHAASNGVDVSEQIDVTVQPAQATTLGIAFGTPAPK
jgi:hypothetical protein